MSRLVFKKYAFVGIDIERSSPLPANGRSEVQPRQRLIATQNANSQRSTIANPKYPRKSPFAVFMSIVAPMSPTTQQCQHSPYRRRKSMSFVGPRNIKVIVFGRNNTAPTLRSGGISSGFSGNPRSAGGCYVPLDATWRDEFGLRPRIVFDASIRPDSKGATLRRYAAAFRPKPAESHLSS